MLLTAPAFAEYEKAVDVLESEKVFFILTEEHDFKVDESILSAIDSVDTVSYTHLDVYKRQPLGPLRKK